MGIEINNSLANTLLIAMPSLKGSFFEQTVTLICDHQKETSMGLVINKLMGMQLGQVFDQLDLHCDDMNLCSMPVFRGGPVSAERGFVLHTSGELWPGTFHIGGNVFLTTSREILTDLAAGKGPETFLIALGYSGWSASQLEDEIMQNAWLTLPASEDIIFDTPNHEKWQKAGKVLGVDIQLMSSAVGHA